MLSSADIKRDIIKNAKHSPINKRMQENPPGISTGEQMEIGNNLEALTKIPGWAIAEQYMLVRMNLVNMAISENISEVQRGVAKGFIEFMQWIQLNIERKNQLVEQERLKHEKTKDVPQDEEK